jgi:hypothetical protein
VAAIKKILSHSVSGDNLQGKVEGREQVIKWNTSRKDAKAPSFFKNYLSLRLCVRNNKNGF